MCRFSAAGSAGGARAHFTVREARLGRHTYTRSSIYKIYINRTLGAYREHKRGANWFCSIDTEENRTITPLPMRSGAQSRSSYISTHTHTHATKQYNKTHTYTQHRSAPHNRKTVAHQTHLGCCVVCVHLSSNYICPNVRHVLFSLCYMCTFTHASGVSFNHFTSKDIGMIHMIQV